jgi:hypothetical protein
MSTLSTTNLKNPDAVGSNIILNADGSSSLNSPVLTGVPTAPTAANGTNTTQIATTEFVLANRSITPTITGGTIPTGGLTYSIPAGCTRLSIYFNDVSCTLSNKAFRLWLGNTSGTFGAGYNVFYFIAATSLYDAMLFMWKTGDATWMYQATGGAAGPYYGTAVHTGTVDRIQFDSESGTISAGTYSVAAF